VIEKGEIELLSYLNRKKKEIENRKQKDLVKKISVLNISLL